MESPSAIPVASAMPADDIAERTRRRVMWRLMPFLLVLYLIAYIDRTNIGVAKLQMAKELQFTETIIGFGAGIFFVGYFLLEIPGTLIVERWSARKWIARIMISWGLVASLMGLVGFWGTDYLSNKNQFYVLRFILGLAEAGFFPGVVVYLSHWFRYEDRGKAKAKFMIGIPISTIIGIPLSRAIMENVTWLNWPGWRWVYILEGIPAVIFGIITLLYLTDRPEQAKWLPADEKEWLVSQLAQEKAKIGASSEGLWQAFKHPQILLLAAIYFFAVTGNYGLTFFLPSITNNLKGLSTFWQTVISILPYIFCVVVILYNGPSSDRTGERRLHTAVPILLTGMGMIGVALTGDMLALTILFVSFCNFAPGAWPSFWSLPSAFLTGSAAAAAVGMINSVGNLGGFIGPYVVGALKDYTGGYKAGTLFLAGCSLLAGFLATRLRPQKK